MQQYDYYGIARGCRSAAINLEARSLTSWSTSRHCVLAKLKDLTIDSYENIKAKAGALLIMLPASFPSLIPDDREHLLTLENAMLQQEVSIPVYFAKYSNKLDSVINEVSQNSNTNDMSKSAVENIINSIAANGYQVVVSSSTPTIKTDAKIASIQGHLTAQRTEGKIPTIGIITYYDSFGVAPDLSFGADSNGSGVVLLLELVRLFSGLYADVKTRGKYNLVFVLTGGGKINYQGSKKWLEDQVDPGGGTFFQDIFQHVTYFMCLDTLATNDSLYMHVSKPPTKGSSALQFYREMRRLGQNQSVHVNMIHKKIRVDITSLGWEHERYRVRKFPAFTVSSLDNHADTAKATILDTRDNLDLDKLVMNTRIIAEALAKQVYNLSAGEIFGGQLVFHVQDASREHMKAWIDFLTLQPRSPQLLINKDNVVVNSLKNAFNNYLTEVKVFYSVPEKRDPVFQFYDVTKGTLNVYSVKPAVFDLILTLMIIVYLGIIYLCVDYFPRVYTIACSVTANKKIKVN
ncbi:hypothetical protein NQ318_003901 [Aromia moschata]|uniref:BOS complex subunit NCLN n=1 Tax=Aromia moschata TaxID=1265417 RepID=A0AAV8ZAJ6_9CUCU|nr:hypothetical protein NQ318_003901 [Aromia moschata]